jgi:hypothetical protein
MDVQNATRSGGETACTIEVPSEMRPMLVRAAAQNLTRTGEPLGAVDRNDERRLEEACLELEDALHDWRAIRQTRDRSAVLPVPAFLRLAEEAISDEWYHLTEASQQRTARELAVRAAVLADLEDLRDAHLPGEVA